MLLPLLSLGLLLPGLCAAKKFDVNENIKLRRFGQYVVNENAREILFQYSEYEPGTDASYSRLYALDMDSPDAAPVQVCPELEHVSNLLHSEELGVSYFTNPAPETGINSLYAYYAVDSKCHLLSDLPVDIDNIKVSPDGTYLAFSADVYITRSESVAKPLSTSVEETQIIANRPYKASVFTHLWVRHWDQEFIEGKKRHVLLARLPNLREYGSRVLTEEDCADVIPGWDADAPLWPFSDASSFSFSADSERFVFVTQVGGDNPGDVAWTTDDTIYMVRVSDVFGASRGHHAVTCLTCASKARDASPQWSKVHPEVVYYTGMVEPQSESDNLRLHMVNTTSMQIVDLSSVVDFSVEQFLLDEDETNIYFVATEHARSSIFRFDLTRYMSDLELGTALPTDPEEAKERYLTRLYRGGSASSLSLVGGRWLYFVHNSYTEPSDLAVVDLQGEAGPAQGPFDGLYKHVLLTHINADITADWDTFYPPLEFEVPSPTDGFPVHSFFFVPEQYQEAAKAATARAARGAGPSAEHTTGAALDSCPLILYVHGGPESPWSDDWSYRWNPQVLVSEGYCVLATNFHGSGSFTLNFTKSIRGEWFSLPFEDTMEAWRHTLATYDFVSKEKTCAMGASYGGTHINWLMGHTDNITCFISHDGIFDLTGFGMDTEEIFFPYRDIGGFSIYELEKYERWNPARSAGKFQKPCLVIHGGMDYRIHEYHGIALFQALLMKGLEARLVYFPTQSHWVWQPQESVYWHTEVVNWLEKHLK